MTHDAPGDPGTLDRRDFLKLGGAAATGFLAGSALPQSTHATRPFSHNPVTAGALLPPLVVVGPARAHRRPPIRSSEFPLTASSRPGHIATHVSCLFR
jgi:hypothetical protein